MINKIYKYRYIFLILFIYITFFYVLNNITYYGDDYEVLNPFHNSQNLGSTWNFVISKMHYFWSEWSGRLVGHFLVSFGLSFFGIKLICFLNPIMLLLMSYLCSKIINLFKKIDILKYIFFIFLFAAGTSIYITRETYYWAYASILYVWSINILLYIILVCFRLYKNKEEITNFKLFILILLIILQAFIIEQLSIILILFLILLIIYSKLKNKKYKLYIILLTICIGSFLISSLAPGNIVRKNQLLLEISNYNLESIIVGKSHLFFKGLFNDYFLGLYFGLFSLFVLNKAVNNKKNITDKISIVIIYSYFVLHIVDLLLNLNFFGDINLFDGNSYFDGLKASETFIPSIIRIIYFVLYLISILRLFRRNYNKYIFWYYGLIITLISTTVPIAAIQYSGLRYYFYTFICLIIMILLMYDDNKILKLPNLILFAFLIPIDVYIRLGIAVIILLIYLLYKNRKIILPMIMIIYALTCLISSAYYYHLNKKIYDYNASILEKAKYGQRVYMKLIPYEQVLYSWHSNADDFMNTGLTHGFYINKWIAAYYGINEFDILVEEKR